MTQLSPFDDENKNNIQIVTPSKYDVPYHVTEYTQVRRKYDIYFNRPIADPFYYSELCQLIRTCDVEDVVYLYLNTTGGSVNTGVQIINAIRDCQGKVVTVLDGTVCSMGAFIFLSGHEFIVHNTGRLMFHNYSGGVIGKGHEQIAQLASTASWVSGLMSEICYPFLTKQEIVSIIEGKDYWLDSAQVRERLDKLHEYEQKQIRELTKKPKIKKEKVEKTEPVENASPTVPSTRKPKITKPDSTIDK